MIRYGPWELRHGSDLLRFEDIRYWPEQSQEEDWHDTLLWVKVVSGEFSGRGMFACYWSSLLGIVSALSELYRFERKETELWDREWENWLKFSMDRSGHLTISGRLYDEVSSQTLEFELVTDQTALGLWLKQIMKQIA